MESAINVGTVVRLFLPRYEGELSPQQAAPDDDPVVHAAEKGTVIIVDDEAPLRAIDAADQVHLLVADVGLPGGMNGKQHAEKACSISPGLKVMFKPFKLDEFTRCVAEQMPRRSS